MFQVVAVFSDINISQGSVATHLRGGGIFYYRFTTNFLLSLSVKEFGKLVRIWKIGQYLAKLETRVGPFSGHGVYAILVKKAATL